MRWIAQHEARLAIALLGSIDDQCVTLDMGVSIRREKASCKMHTVPAQQEKSPGSITHNCPAAIAVEPDRYRFVAAHRFIGSAAGGGLVIEARGGAELKPVGQPAEGKDGAERTEKLEEGGR